MRQIKWFAVILLCIIAWSPCFPQDSSSVYSRIISFPEKFFAKVQSKTSNIDRMLTRKTEKYLQRLARKEERLKRKLYRVDSTAAKTLFGNSQQKYATLLNKLKTDSSTAPVRMVGAYQPYTDSLAETLSYLQQLPSSSFKAINGGRAESALKEFNQLQNKFQDAEQIKQFIRQRKEQIKAVLSKYTNLPRSVENAFGQYKKDAYYYGTQIREYKELLNDPDKLERTALSLLNKLPAFRDFMSQHSQLAGLFNLSGNYNPNFTQGLQSRNQLSSFIQSRVGSIGSNSASILQQNIQSAQGQVDQLRNKLNAAGSSDLDIPDFKPSTVKTKSFLQRFELGTNLQTTRSSYFFPTTTDLGFSLGYRISDKNIFGFGTSLKVGWGNDLKHIAVSGQGIGLRTFADINIRKSFFGSAGFEYNYQRPFPLPSSINGNIDLKSWQQSGLIGLSKIVSLKTKMFKKSKIQLLWDYLSYSQVPKSQPFKFRVGYNF